MAVLVYRADAGGVVPRNELLDAVWPRMAFTQDALSQCIVELRKAFRESSKEPRVIETIPKVGIRLMAPAVAADAEEAANATDASPTAPPLAVTTHFPLWQRVAFAATGIAIAAGAAWLWLPQSFDRRAGNTDEIAVTSTRARDCFTSAEEYRQRTNRADALPREVRLYECAVEEDPSFALAWALLSRAHLGMYWIGLDQTPGRLAQAREAIDRALTLDPELPEAHIYFANYLYRGKHEYEAALSEFAVAERLAPGNAEVYFLRSSLYRRLGNMDLSIRDGEKAIARPHEYRLLAGAAPQLPVPARLRTRRRAARPDPRSLPRRRWMDVRRQGAARSLPEWRHATSAPLRAVPTDCRLRGRA
jgi:DNA-binding winged helix-turn-helix (wHTH) protein